MPSDIDEILYPTVLSNLRENVPPVQCIIWKGGKEYELIEFENVYPFDTIDDIKRMICAHYKSDATFLPRFTFVGVPMGESAYSTVMPPQDTTYLPIDYLWYPNGTNDPTSTYYLKHPKITLSEPDNRFVTSTGHYASPSYEVRGRSTVEKVFLQPRDNRFPVFHVFTLDVLMKEYEGMKPIAETDWNNRFAPYFPEVKMEGPYEANEEDEEFLKKIVYFVANRSKSLGLINRLLEEGATLPRLSVTGIRQMWLTWKKPVRDFDGSASMFYQILATKERPYIRLLPAEGSGITKLHVKGVLPIPSLEDPRILEIWNKEVSPTPDLDFCCIKYIQRPANGITPPIYGTIHVLNDGTINLLLQPPKNLRKLDPILDFRNFTGKLTDVFTGLPQAHDAFELRELAIMFSMKIVSSSKKFTAGRIRQRLPYFQTVLKEIKSLPEDSPMISLRYKAVNNYATEDMVLTFITQLSTQFSLYGESSHEKMIEALQNEFQFSRKEALDSIGKWLKRNEVFTLQLPEEDEFIGSFNPGIDIHIYPQHPYYFVHANRIDNDETYKRICTIMSLLFVEEDEYFRYDSNEALSVVEEELEQQSMKREMPEDNAGTAASASIQHGMEPEENGQENAPEWALHDPMANMGANENMFTNADMDAPAAAATAATAVKAPVKVPAQKIENDRTQRLIDPQMWFINKLKEVDPRLFQYKPANKDDKGYTRQCAGNDDRQPSVLTKEEYDRMREIYETDDDLFWIIYPLEEGAPEPIQPNKDDETVTMMRYGSGGDTIHYYFCPKYFCLNDGIMIREVDFEAITDRDGLPKPENTCPFCYGSLITNRKKATMGHTVIKRKVKGTTDTHHAYMEFMSKTSHPENFALPCCFVKHKTLRIDQPQFSHLRDFLQLSALQQNENHNEDDDQSYDQLVLRSGIPIEYGVLFQSMYKKYILEYNKQPVPGHFAIAPPEFDKYFRQNSTESIIERTQIHLGLRKNAVGFLRVGTEHSINESLLGVIAPLLYRNYIHEVKQRILEVVVPRIFINSHFGNLVLEFYNPADPNANPETKQQLMQWSHTHLGIAVNSTNMYALLRIFNSYHRFIDFINDPTKRKDLRHIQPLLSEPGLFTINGLQLIVLEEGEEGVSVRCPIFGVSADRHKNNDFAFISRSIKKSSPPHAYYELYIHTSNQPAKGGTSEIHENIVLWEYTSRKIWPEIVSNRIDEYTTQCQSRYRSLYTLQQGVHPMAMIPLSKGAIASSKVPEGIVKDSYNHIIGITFRSKAGSSASLVSLPVVDDGVVSISSAFSIKNIYLDWDDIKPAPAEDIIKYYRTELETLFSLYPGYRVRYVVRRPSENKIVAIQLENGIYIPAGEPKNQAALDATGIKMIDIEQFEWMINKQLAGIKTNPKYNDWSKIELSQMIDNTTAEKSCGSDIELLRTSSYKEFEELYQQFRLMVSNWLTSPIAGAEIRQGIEDIIFDRNLPEYERRKRLYIYISTELLSWFYPDKDWEPAETSFLRKDCRMMKSPDSCTGNCHWRQDDDSKDDSEGKCLLHVKNTVELGDKETGRVVSTPELFTKRIIDELVRFPNRRKQLMKKGEISTLSTIIKPIHQGDQYIIPESSGTWTNLLRLDWATQTLEEPQYYEEMTREADEEDTQSQYDTLPDELVSIFGENSPFRIMIPKTEDSSNRFLPFTGILGVSMEQIEMDSTKTMGIDNMIQYVRTTSRPIGVITVGEEQPIQFAKPRTGTFDTVAILVFLSNGTIGMLFEDGNSSVSISQLPQSVQERWSNAHMPPIVKRIETEDNVLLVPGMNPIMAKKQRRPLISRVEPIPLVEAAQTAQTEPEKKEKRRPRIVRAVQQNAQADTEAVQASSIPASIAASIPASAISRKPRIIRNQSKRNNQ